MFIHYDGAKTYKTNFPGLNWSERSGRAVPWGSSQNVIATNNFTIASFFHLNFSKT